MIQPYIDAAIKIWQENTPTARIAMLLMVVLSVVAIGGVGYWSIQPSFVLLASQADGAKLDAIIDALDKEGIAYELSGAGGNLLVDKRYFARARLIARNEGAAVGTETASSGGFADAFASPSERRNRARVQKEQSLAATIKRLNVVDDANVHLNVPDKTPFLRDQGKASASVLLTLRVGTELNEQQANSIASLVAYAVDNLEPEDVQITDKNGRSYTLPNEQVHQIASQVEYVTQAEQKLARKAESQLYKFLGAGNSNVEVALDLTFTNGSRKTTKYDPDSKVPSQEDLVTETTTNVPNKEEGTTGVQANLQSRRALSNSMESKTENIKTSYLVAKTEETETNTTPIRNSLTVSVLINSLAEGIKQEDGTLAPGLNERVEAIVKNAVGFKVDTDTISVEFMPFPESELTADVAPATFDWNRVTDIIESSSLAIAAVLAFVIGLMLLRRFKPLQEPAPQSSPGLRQEQNESVQQLTSLIQRNPEVFADIVKSWVGADVEEESQKRKAA